jgi:hypothetical protein
MAPKTALGLTSKFESTKLSLLCAQPGEDTDLLLGMTVFAMSIPPQVIPASAVVPEI